MRKKSLVVKVWGSRLGSDIRILLKISFCLWAALARIFSDVSMGMFSWIASPRLSRTLE